MIFTTLQRKFRFADDTNLLYGDKNLKSLEETVNSRLVKVSDWLNANKLTLIAEKSNFVIFCPYQRKMDLRSLFKCLIIVITFLLRIM